jgi:hypothetical protein
MTTITVDKELLLVATKTVGSNGQISVGKEHAGKTITAYIFKEDNK